MNGLGHAETAQHIPQPHTDKRKRLFVPFLGNGNLGKKRKSNRKKKRQNEGKSHITTLAEIWGGRKRGHFGVLTLYTN
jgi:hypothetical protein